MRGSCPTADCFSVFCHHHHCICSPVLKRLPIPEARAGNQLHGVVVNSAFGRVGKTGHGWLGGQ